MPHIISDHEYRELTDYRSTGKTPEEIMKLVSYSEDPAPLPLSDHEELHLGEGLLDEEDPPIVDDPWADK